MVRDGRDGSGSEEPLAEEASDSSTEGWDDYADRAEDEPKQDEDDESTTGFPDVEVLADSMRNLADELTGDDERGGKRGAP